MYTLINRWIEIKRVSHHKVSIILIKEVYCFLATINLNMTI
jgi:hypothetical protein